MHRESKTRACPQPPAQEHRSPRPTDLLGLQPALGLPLPRLGLPELLLREALLVLPVGQAGLQLLALLVQGVQVLDEGALLGLQRLPRREAGGGLGRQGHPGGRGGGASAFNCGGGEGAATQSTELNAPFPPLSPPGSGLFNLGAGTLMGEPRARAGQEPRGGQKSHAPHRPQIQAPKAGPEDWAPRISGIRGTL